MNHEVPRQSHKHSKKSSINTLTECFYCRNVLDMTSFNGVINLTELFQALLRLTYHIQSKITLTCIEI